MPPANTAARPARPCRPEKIRSRGQIFGYVAVTLFVMFTIGTAALNLLPGRHRPTPREILHDEFADIIAARRARIVELQQTLGDRCERFQAPELARALVMDGRWADARKYADAYEARCGADANVRKWGDAPIVASARVR